MKSLRGLLVALVVASCGADPAAESAFPGELGAPCTTREDCDEGLLCTLEYDADADYSDCFMPCTGEGGTCPAGSFCALRASAEDPYPWVCRRECNEDAGCFELHPDATACKEFTGNPAGKKSCGIKG
jgi:hypothetical protein